MCYSVDLYWHAPTYLSTSLLSFQREDRPWIEIDLGLPCTINSVELVFAAAQQDVACYVALSMDAQHKPIQPANIIGQRSIKYRPCVPKGKVQLSFAGLLALLFYILVSLIVCVIDALCRS
jgi:hypothetical protein